LRALRAAGNAVTKINEIFGKATALLIYPLMLLLTFEVFMRYILIMPTRYSYDLSQMTYIAFVALGAGYALSRDAHVKVDVFYNKLKRRGRMIIDLISYPAFFFVAMGGFLYVTYRYVIYAWVGGEVGLQSPWRYPMWPIRSVMFISILLLTLQGIVKFAEAFKKPGGGDSK